MTTDRLPAVWLTAACLLVVGVGLLCVTLVLRPKLGLTITWSVAAPALPLLFMVAPSVWRNLCPLALMNQLPRLGGFGRGLAPPRFVTRHGFTVAVAGFAGLVALRPVLLDRNGPATAGAIGLALVAAFMGGLLVKGKAGWCGTICPLYAPQRLYGRAPVVRADHAHCRPCVGCLRSCTDLSPTAATAAESSRRPESRLPQLLVGAGPGLVLGYFVGAPLVPGPIVATMLAVLAPAAATGLTYLTVLRYAPLASDRHRRALNHALAAATLGLFYTFALPDVLALIGGDHPDVVAVARLLTVVVAFGWWVRDYRPTRESASAGRRPTPVETSTVITFLGADGRRPVTTARGETLAAAARLCGMSLSTGCGVGACGADPVAVVDGAEHLTEPTGRELATLRRIGAPAGVRLACVARVTGPVSVRTGPPPAPPAGGVDLTIESVAIIGAGIAGITAAEHIRRLHPTCAIHLIGDEPYRPYNRMALTDLLTGGSALADLEVLPPDWTTEHRVHAHVGVVATAINPAAGTVTLNSGDVLTVDRLVLATGACPITPLLRGLPLPGVFTLRTAADALAVRGFAESRADLRHAVVVGAGPLGIEVAAGLADMGFEVCLVDRDPRPAAVLLDERGGELVRAELGALGVEVRTGVTVRWVLGPHRVGAVRLADGQRVPCDLLLMCAGTRPNVELARRAGLATRVGVLVDDGLRTSHPRVFAVGDAAEHVGGVSGLWVPAMEQAEVVAEQVVAALPALARRYRPRPTATRLAVPTLNVFSIGRVNPGPGDRELVERDDERERRYVKLVVSANGRAVGGLAIGDPDAAARMEMLVGHDADLRPTLVSA